MNILQELWYGNIYPNEQPIQKNGAYAQALHKVVEAKERLFPTLSPALRAAFEQLMDIQMAAAAIAERDAFTLGFRLGVQILLESLPRHD